MFTILHGIFYPNRNLHQTSVETRIATNQVMELENSLQIFVIANNHGTMNAIVNQEGTAVDTLLCVVNQGRFVKI